MKRLALALTVTITAFLGLGQMASAQYGPTGSATTISNGSTTVTYTGCVNGETITFTFPGATSVTAVCAGGAATASLPVPGPGTGTARGTTSPAVTFTVASQAPATNPPGGLPATGSNGIDTSTGLAAGLLVVGLGLFVVAQVRRRQPNLA